MLVLVRLQFNRRCTILAVGQDSRDLWGKKTLQLYDHLGYSCPSSKLYFLGAGVGFLVIFLTGKV